MFRSLLIVAASWLGQAPEVDYKVVTWYDRADPIATFAYRGYDVRKGEYSPAVAAWLEMMREKHPNYVVTTRDVALSREPGVSERRQVGAVIQRELLAAAEAEGVFPGFSAADVVGKAPRTARLRPLAEPGPRLPPMPLMLRQNPTPYGFPVPMPYPRPHP